MGGSEPEIWTVDEHRARILEAIEPLTAFPQPLMEALGLAAAEDVVAATAESPVHLPVVGEIGAGQGGLMALAPGTAAKIMTGAPIPAGADSVVPYEWTDRGVV